MRQFGRRLKIVTLWTAAVFLALAVLSLAVSIGAYTVLLYGPVQERAVRFAEEKMAEYFVGEITVERLQSNLLSYVELYGVRAIGKSEYGDSIYVGHAIIRYWAPSLLRKRVRVTSAEVTDVRGHIVMEQSEMGGKIMLPLMPKYLVDSNYILLSNYEEAEESLSTDIPNPANWPVEVVIGNARVNGISAVYRDLENNMVGEIMNASATGRFHAIDSFTVQLRVPDASYHSPWWNGTLDTIGASGTITWKGLEVHSMLVEGSGTRVTGGGKLCYYADLPWDLRANFKTTIHPLPVLYTYVEGVNRDGILEGTAYYGGKLYEPIYSARVKGRGIKFRGYEINGFDVEASYGEDEYGRARVRGSSAFGEFDVNAALLMKHLNHGPEFGEYSASAVLTGLNAKRITDELGVELPVHIGDANVRLKIAGCGSGEGFSEPPSVINLSAELDGGDIAGGPVDVGMDIAGGDWIFTGGWGVNSFGGRGRINLLGGNFNGTVNAELADPSVISRTLFKERVAGGISASADIKCQLYKPIDISVSSSIRGDKIVWRGAQADSLDAFLTVEKGVPRLTKVDAKLYGRVDSVASYFGLDSLSGYVETEFSMDGGFADPFIHAQVFGKDLRYRQYGLDEAYGVFALEKDTLRWNDLRLREKSTLLHSSGKFKYIGNMSLSADGELYIAPDGVIKNTAGRIRMSGSVSGDSLRARCRITSAALNILDPWLPEAHRVKGTLSLNGEFFGTPQNPNGRINFQVTDPRYYGNRAFTFVGDAILSDSLLHAVSLLRVTQTSGAVEVKASLPFLPSSNWKLDERGARPAFFRAVSQNFDVAAVKGFLGEDLGVSGAVTFDIGTDLGADGWNVSGALSLPNGAARYIPLNISAPSVNINASASGTIDKPEISYTVATGAVIKDSLRAETSVIKGRSCRDTLFVDDARFTFGESSHIDVSGIMLYGGMDSLLYNGNFRARYAVNNFPASFFSYLLPEYDLRKGRINGSGVISAADGKPMVDGELNLSRLELTIPDISPSVGPINASVKLSNNTMELTSAEAKWGRGAITAAGRASFDIDKLYDIDMNIRAAALAFELPEVVTVGVQNADLRVSDRNDSLNVQGRISLAPTSYTRDVNILSMLSQMQTAATDIRREPSPFLRKIRLMVDLDLAGNMNVNINLGSAHMDGRLTIVGIAADPGIVGEVRIEDGFVYYLDRKFDITQGTLFNPDATTVNPTLNIVASSDVIIQSPTARTETYTITMTLLGTLENPAVRLTAEPSLSEIDIISVLTFGERMGGMGSDISDRMMNIVAHQALGLGTRRIERLLNVDRVSVTGDIMGTGSGASQGTTLGVTKRFSQRLNLTYETNVGNLNDQKVTAQYRLMPNLFLEGQTANNGENALDLIFRYSK